MYHLCGFIIQEMLIFSATQSEYVPYTVLVSSELPTTLTAPRPESLLIAALLVSDLDKLFMESCAQVNVSVVTSYIGDATLHCLHVLGIGFG